MNNNNIKSLAGFALALAGTGVTATFLALFYLTNYHGVTWAFAGIISAFYTLHKLSKLAGTSV